MKKTIFFALATLVVACNSTPSAKQLVQSENLDWLLGKWKRLNDEKGNQTFENWTKVSPREYAGIGFTLQNGDTISQEQMTFRESDGTWKLLVKTPEEKTPVEFKMSELSKNKFVCMNDSIDFPTKIRYWKEGERLKASISNKSMEIPFDFEKSK